MIRQTPPWAASLNVERAAKVGDTLRSHRTLTRDDVTSGSKLGWCEANAKAIDRLVDARSDTFRTALLALVDQDRGAILADAETEPTKTCGG